jgi:hypothetical protein
MTLMKKRIKVKLVKPVNKPIDFLKFINMLFSETFSTI